ncbi:sugar ABC transporter substrate-binding protein [Priestia abyssalis]|uniref:sugar ABC transporter substrate-binding protein n=1 Tax=Priestia abyssalis TaxID=1221450 RepID=UPI00099512EE|nr:sugar ABC transporter substrate-binding protein [Priestia abyssalis]
MKNKWIIPLIFVSFIIISISFLKGNEKPKVVAVLQELNTDHSKIVKAGIEKGFADFDIDGKVMAPNLHGPTSKQVTMLKDVLKKKPDVLIVTPTQSSAVITALKEYQKRNIPVLILNQDTRWTDQTTSIGTDHLKLGKIAGEVLSSTLQPGDQVVFIFDSQDHSFQNDWIKGAKENLDNIGARIITKDQADEKSGNEKLVISNILQTSPNIKGMFVTNDNIALNALKVIEEKELKIPVIGTYENWEMLKAVEDEKLSVALSQNPFDTGYLSVEQALKTIKGEHVEKRIDSGVDIITKDNVKANIDFYAKIVFK